MLRSMTPSQQKIYDRAREEILGAAGAGASGEAVKSLNLSDRGLAELPPEIGKCGQLRRLYLKGNQLRELPAEIGRCGELRLLNVSDNQLAELPPEAGGWTQLESLFLNGNRLSGLPSELGQCGQLQVLSLSDNRLTALPREMAGLRNLEVLDLSANQLSALPGGLRELRKLRALYLHGNSALGLPSSLLGPSWADSGPGHEKAAEPRAMLDAYFSRLPAEPAPAPPRVDAQGRRPLSLFVSYARKNRAQADRLSEQLEWLDQHGFVQPWDDSQLIAGQEFDAMIRERLGQADLILLLVSAPFLTSKYIREVELPIALERHGQKRARVVWIRLDDSLLSQNDVQERRIAALQCATAGSKPISSYSPRANGWIEVRHAIEKAVADFRRQSVE